jgi:ribonuclease P protein subunit POP4
LRIIDGTKNGYNMQDKHLKKTEFIGRYVQIKSCTDPMMNKMEGIIIDETQQMFLVESSGKKKWIAKSIASFVFPIDKKTFVIKGKNLQFRPEERVKKAR